jgi:hypothetical protein
MSQPPSKKKLTISDCDEHLAIKIITETREIMMGYPTLTNVKACYNIMCGLLNLCSIRGTKKGLTKIANDFHKGMLEHIESLYDD